MYRNVLLWTFVLMITAGCSSGGLVSPPFELIVTGDHNGQFNILDSIVVSATGLIPGEYPVTISAINEAGETAIESYYTADQSGRIDNAIIANEIGYWPDSEEYGLLKVGTYTIRLESLGGTLESEVTIPGTPNGPIIYECWWMGEPGHWGYNTVRAEGMSPGATYRVWLVPDRRSWNNNDVIADEQHISLLSFDIVADENGKAGPVEYDYNPYFFGAPDEISADVVLDAEPYGIYNTATDDVFCNEAPGILYQVVINWEMGPFYPIYEQMASRRDYTNVDQFIEGDEVFVWLYSDVTTGRNGSFAQIYIVDHRDEWPGGTKLRDVTEGVESILVQYETFATPLVLAWSEAVEGEYDVVLDYDADGYYDLGDDVIDGGPDGPGFIVTRK